MKKTKQKQIAGVSYDTFIDNTGKEPPPKIIQKKYANKLIAFLDILGIRQLIENNRNGNEHIAIDKIEEMRKIVNTSSYISNGIEDFNYLHISDSFVFVCEPKSVISLIELLSTIQTRIISECNFLLRGAITVGDAIIREDGKFIIGPAYILAFQLQEDDAIYPRIIADKGVIKQLKRKVSIDKYLQQDLDKEYFIDYLKVYMNREKLKKKDMTIRLRRENNFCFLKEEYKKHYEKNNHNISQKYGWTIQYYKNLGIWENGYKSNNRKKCSGNHNGCTL